MSAIAAARPHHLYGPGPSPHLHQYFQHASPEALLHHPHPFSALLGRHPMAHFMPAPLPQGSPPQGKASPPRPSPSPTMTQAAGARPVLLSVCQKQYFVDAFRCKLLRIPLRSSVKGLLTLMSHYPRKLSFIFMVIFTQVLGDLGKQFTHISFFFERAKWLFPRNLNIDRKYSPKFTVFFSRKYKRYRPSKSKTFMTKYPTNHQAYYRKLEEEKKSNNMSQLFNNVQFFPNF